jgi:hypothetical protein
VILLVVVGTIGLLAREGGKVLDSRDNPPPTPTNSRVSPRGEGLSNPEYWLLMSLFLRRIDSYGSPLEPFFMVVFTLCAALAAVSVLPAIFAG